MPKRSAGPTFARVLSLRTFAAMVVGVLVVYSANLLWSHFADAKRVPKDLAPVSLSEAPIVGDPSMPIAERSVLGTASSLSPDRLRIFLMATQPGATPLLGTAQLGTDPRNPQTFVAGATLVNGARIAEIHRDHVVLERDGRRTVLQVDQQAGIEAAGPQVVSGGHLTASTSSILRRELTSVEPVQAGTVVPRAAPRRLQGDINEIARAQPIFRGRDVAGFAVMAGSRAGLFSRMGLENGDIVTSVNGVTVHSAEQWNELSNALLAGESMGVTVERNGQLTAMILDGKQALSGPDNSMPVLDMASSPLPQ